MAERSKFRCNVVPDPRYTPCAMRQVGGATL